MKPNRNCFLVSALSALLLAPTAFAGNTWDGGGTAVSGLFNWSDNLNWDSDTAPAYGTLLTFAGSTGLTSNNNGATSSIVGITFNSGAGAFTLSGSSVTLGGNITNSSTTAQTIDLPLVLDNNRTINTTNGNITLNGPISGAFNLIKSQGNTLTMNTAGSSFSRLQINTGVVKLGVNDALPTAGGLTFSTSNGTLDLNGKTQTLGGTIIIGSNVTGTATISDTAGGGLLKLGNDVTQNAPSLSNVTISAALDLNGATRSFTLGNATTTFEVSGAISNSTGTAGLTKAGVGTLTLSGANTFNGNTTVTTGLLTLSNALALQNSTLDTTNSIASSSASTGLKTTVTTLTLGGLSGNKNLASLFDSANGYGGVTALSLNPALGQTPNYSGVIINGAAGMTLTKSGAGTQTLSGGAGNTLSGAINVNGGTLAITKGADDFSSAKNMPGAITVLSGATLSFDQAFRPAPDNNLTNALNLSGPGTSATVGAFHLFGNATASGPITLDADATITKSFNNGFITGSITGADKNLTLKTTLPTQLGLTVSAPITLGTGGITVTGAGGTGIVTLSGANSYSGGTTITAGTLNFANTSALGSGGVAFTGDSTLQAGVATTLANAVSVASGVTGTVDTNNNATTLSEAITGAGAFIKSGTGVLTLTGGLNNTLAGGITVSSGRLQISDGLSFTNMPGAVTVSSGAAFSYSKNFAVGNDLPNAITLSGTGTDGLGALNLYGNATSTGAITLAADATISHNFNNATISGSITGTNRNLQLTTIAAGQPGMVISGPITLGTGGITVAAVPVVPGETNIVTLSGNNSYSGETRVQTGTLMLSGSARIPDASTVRIDSGAVLNLDFAATDTVAALFLPGDPNPKPNGTYGSLTSTATNKSADFAGNGILQVGPGGNNYASWANTNSIPGQPFDGDFNMDGISNGVAYALGLSPTLSSQPAGALVGTTITFTKGADAIANADVTWIIETSLTLEANSWTSQVTQAAGDATATISYNLAPAPGTPKKFARLKAVKVP